MSTQYFHTVRLGILLLLAVFYVNTSTVFAQEKALYRSSKPITELQCPRKEAPPQKKVKTKKEVRQEKRRPKEHIRFGLPGCPSF